jgi:hypothetical protein
MFERVAARGYGCNLTEERHTGCLVDTPVVDVVLASELGYSRTRVVASHHGIHLSLGQAIMEPPNPLGAGQGRFVLKVGSADRPGD